MMKLKSDLYTANGTRELIVTDQIYNSIQFDEEKTTEENPPSSSRRKSAKKNDKESKEDKQRRRQRSSANRVGKRRDKTRSNERNKGKESGESGAKRKAKSDSSVITEMTSVKSSRTSSRYSINISSYLCGPARISKPSSRENKPKTPRFQWVKTSVLGFFFAKTESLKSGTGVWVDGIPFKCHWSRDPQTSTNNLERL
jgi:hypothetical protein